MKRLVKIIRQLARNSSGSALVEATVVMPVIIVLTIGAVDFGLIFSTQATAQKTMRDATRYFSRVPASGVCLSWAQDNAKHLAVYGSFDSTVTTPVIPGYDVSDVTVVSPTAGECAAGTVTVVRLEADVSYSAPLLGSAFFGFSNSHTLHVEHEEQFIGR